MANWKNRIVGYGEEAPDQLLANPLNFRTHPKHQQEALAGVLDEVGVVQNIIVNRTTGHLIDGHLRVTLAMRQNQPTIPVTYVELSEAEEKEILATLDPITALATTDKEKLDELLQEVRASDARVTEMISELAKENGLYLTKDESDAEPQIDKAAELNKKWQVKTGDLWKIGEHRLLCGDSTKREDVEKVMGGERAALAPVDPPYNVNKEYDGKTVDDAKTELAYEKFSRAWFDCCRYVSVCQIVTPGGNNLVRWCRYFDPYYVVPWTKSNSMTNGKVARFWCWEPVLFYGEKWNRSRANDLFDFAVGQQKDVADHPCPKPLKMWADLIENYSELGDIIYEAFGGSGTTMVACENLGRKCRGIEISPDYCAVILERMKTAFPNIEIERIGTP